MGKIASRKTNKQQDRNVNLHPKSDIRHPTSDIRHPTSFFRLVFGFEEVKDGLDRIEGNPWDFDD
jgi:hypothetical protein